MTLVWDLQWDWSSVTEFWGDSVTYSLKSSHIEVLGKKAVLEAISQAKGEESLVEADRVRKVLDANAAGRENLLRICGDRKGFDPRCCSLRSHLISWCCR